MSSGGGTIHEGAPPLGDVCCPSWTYMHWDSSVPSVGSTAPQVEAQYGNSSNSLHSFILVGH